MVCPKCGSENVSVQVVNDVEMKNAHHGFFWWLLIGWWWMLIKWFVFTVPALIVKIFSPKKKKLVTKSHTVCVCQACGHRWDV